MGGNSSDSLSPALGFEGVNGIVFFCFTAFVVIAWVLGALGNALTVYTVATVKSLWTISNVLVASLAVSDLITITVSMPIMYSRFAFPDFFREHDFVCKLSFYLLVPFNTISVNQLQLIAANRYCIITQPRHRYNRFWGRRPTSIMISSIWLYATVFNFLPMIGFGEVGYIPEIGGCGLVETNNYSWWYKSVILINVFESCVVASPLFFILALKKIRATKRRIHVLRANRSTVNAGGYRGFSREEMAVTKMVMLMFLCFVLTYTPYNIVHIVSRGVSGVPAVLTAMFLVFATSNSLFNPFIYAGMNSNIRKAFRMFFQWDHSSTSSNVAVIPHPRGHQTG